MTDTYRSFLARRLYGNTPPEQPVARVASDAGRIAAAKIAYALSRSGNSVVPGPPRAPLSPSNYAGGGGGVVANDIMGQRGPVVVGPHWRQHRKVRSIRWDLVMPTDAKLS
jgi:hypothetical protein